MVIDQEFQTLSSVMPVYRFQVQLDNDNLYMPQRPLTDTEITACVDKELSKKETQEKIERLVMKL